MVNSWKVGVGAGSIIFGVYFLFQNSDIISVILGVSAVAFGIGLIASSLR